MATIKAVAAEPTFTLTLTATELQYIERASFFEDIEEGGVTETDGLHAVVWNAMETAKLPDLVR